MIKNNQKLLVVVTGLSGAGKSCAIKALEDLGFYSIDNLPVELLEHVIDQFILRRREIDRIAIGMDVRSKSFAHNFPALKAKISQLLRVEILFLGADEDVIVQRYSTTRRKHPILDEGGELVASIRRESDLLTPIEEIADTKFDTSCWSPNFLTRSIEEIYSKATHSRHLHVTVVSFGFKYGLLKQADSVYDVRFLRNPYFDPGLREMTGLEPNVRDFVMDDIDSSKFVDSIMQLHRFLLPRYYQEGKHYFRIGIGCTGGKHRSVVIAEELAARLARENIPETLFSVVHRDIDSATKPRL